MDREKVIKELESLRDICNAKSNMAIGKGKVAWAGYANAADDAIVLLKEQERKTGEWITIWREDDPDTSTSERCSVCERISERPVGEYCKWCGAHMTE